MRNASWALVGAMLIAGAVDCWPQVLAPAEILDAPMRELQRKHFAELKEAAVDITTHHFPYKFYLSRTLDISETEERLTDQRSIYFAKFKDRTVLQVTGNYFASYSDATVDRSERIKRTYADVMLPILRAAASRLAKDTPIDAFALEVGYHVRKGVLGVTVESPENLALIIPRLAAENAASGQDAGGEVALKQSSVYVDSQPFALWPGTPAQEAASSTEMPAPSPSADLRAVPVAVLTQPSAPATAPAQPTAPVAVPTQPAAPVAAPAQPSAPVAIAAPPDLSAEALQKMQSSYQESLTGMVHDLNAQAHFVSYAPPALIAFRNMAYLQLSITTELPSSDAGSQYRLAALAFDRHVSHLIRPVLGYFKGSPEFGGIDFSSTVKVPGPNSDSSIVQSVEFFFPLPALRRYEQYDITGQQLIDTGFVLINGERVGLDLQSAESGAAR